MKLFISGYGKMGRMIEQIILSRNIEYAGWTEAVTETDPALAKECVCIDFTTPAAIRANYRFLAENFKAVVIGTTGWADIHDEVVAYFEKCGTPMIWASNFSIGVNVYFAVTDYISRMLGKFGGYSPYMVEMHHCHKLDAPSGTAIALAEALNEGAGGDYTFTYDRSQRRAPRDDKEIGVSALRGGTVVGIHDVVFAGQDEVIEFKHTAYSRAIFAKGAVQAAKFLAGKEAGMYDMSDVIG